MNFDYTPPPTLRRFMLSDARVRAVRGPVGSAKSTACVMELLRRATAAPKQEDGIRRSKMVIVRNTLQQLKTTNLVTIQQLLRPIVNYKVSDQTLQVRMPGVESDWLLLPLDTPENVQRLLSLELTAAWVSEFREIDPEIVQAVLSRCGRYPSRAVVKAEDQDFWYGVVMETNSFTEDSQWFELLEENLPANWDYFIQPGAFEPGAENRENLPPRYYEDLMESNSEDWVDQYVHNRIGPSLSGQSVFRKSFNHQFHVAQGELTPVPGYPLIIGMDTGRNPAAVIGQLDHTSRLLVFRSLYAENMGMELFLNTVLKPELQLPKYVTSPTFLVMDPACRQTSQIGEESVIGCAKRLGFAATPAMTNNIDPRLRAVESYFSQQRNGGAAVLLDPVGCRDLVLAIGSRYRYKVKKDRTIEETPEKLHPWSDLADAFQYLCLGTNERLRGRIMAKISGRDTSRTPAPSVAGWT